MPNYNISNHDYNCTNKVARLGAHVRHASGKRKTICTSAVLGYFGISPDKYRVCSSFRDIKRILSRFGYKCASRNSKVIGDSTYRVMGRSGTITLKGLSMGKVREKIKSLGGNGMYYVSVYMAKGSHAILLDNKGRTIIDTAPRKRDVRKVWQVTFISRKDGNKIINHVGNRINASVHERERKRKRNGKSVRLRISNDQYARMLSPADRALLGI